jgi:hypothetical protein
MKPWTVQRCCCLITVSTAVQNREGARGFTARRSAQPGPAVLSWQGGDTVALVQSTPPRVLTPFWLLYRLPLARISSGLRAHED